jgi:SAM-dependent methyltransferase
MGGDPMMRLNLGAGSRRDVGWTHLDREGDGLDVVHDLTVLPLPFETGSCEAVVLHHVLDLLAYDVGFRLISESYRVLGDGGYLRISLAHLLDGIRAAMCGDKDWFVEQRETLDLTLAHFILQGGHRRAVWSPDALRWKVAQVGFVETRMARFEETSGPAWLTELDGRITESVFLEGRKP